jgi:restriction endonuclease Mrr
MSIPDFQSFMLPLLKFTADKEVHKQSEDADIYLRTATKA